MGLMALIPVRAAVTVLVGAALVPFVSAQTLEYEAESLARTSSGASTSVQVDAAASGGQWISLNANSVGDRMSFTLPSVPAGSYSVVLRFKANENRGTMNLVVDGTQLGGGINQRSEPFYTDWTAGRVSFPTAGDHVLSLVVIGRDPGASSYRLSADAFRLEPSDPPAPTVVVEAEDAGAVGSGATVSTASVAGASGGVVQFLNGNSVGDSMTLTTPVIAAGPYLVKFRYRTNSTRAKHTLDVSGNVVNIDQYASSTQFVEVTLPYMFMDIATSHTIVLTVTGKNSASSGYIVSADRITFIGQ